MCDRIPYDDQAEAVKASRRRSKQSGFGMKSYRCNDCGFWHLASKGRFRQQNNTAKRPKYPIHMMLQNLVYGLS
jgi:hypothetical protein